MNGPPPASSSDLAAIARRFVGSQGTPPKSAARASVGECGGETESERSAVSRADSFTEEARTPTGGSRFFGFGEAVGTLSCAPETAPTSVDDLVDRAVARANAFSDAQTRAFGEACAQSRWCAVNKLSGDEVRTRPTFSPAFRLWVFFRRFRSFCPTGFSVVGTFSKAVSVVGTFSWPQENAPRRPGRGLTRERRVNFFETAPLGFFRSFSFFLSATLCDARAPRAARAEGHARPNARGRDL